MSSGPSHLKDWGITQHTHSNTAISPSLKISSSTLSQGMSGTSNSFPVEHLLINASVNHSCKLLAPFLTELASILNLESPLGGPMSINSAWPGLIPFHHYPRPLSPFPHTFPRFLLEWIGNSVSYLVMYAVHFLGVYTFCLSSGSLFNLQSDYRSSGNYWWDISSVLPGISSRASQCWLGQQQRANFFSHRWKRQYLRVWDEYICEGGGTTSSGEINTWEPEGSKLSASTGSSTHLHPKLQEPILYQLMP